MNLCDKCKENSAKIMTAMRILTPAFVCEECNICLNEQRQEETISDLKEKLSDLPWKEAREIVGNWVDTEYYSKWLEENKELVKALKPFAEKAKKILDAGNKPPTDLEHAYDILIKFGLLNKYE